MGRTDESSFAQEYDATASAVVGLFIYCRLCRRTFKVSFQPRPAAKLRCTCGREAPLAELDVFRGEARAKDFAALYEKLYTAAKDALRAANIPIPPSQKLRAIREGDVPSDITSPREGNLEDASDIASAYVGAASETRGEEARTEEKILREAVSKAKGVLERHEALSQLVEHLYCMRSLDTGVPARFEKACREDMALAKDVVAEAKRRKAAGRTTRVAFTSFKHLAIHLEEKGETKAALAVAEAAIALGLAGYDERAARLRAVPASTAPATSRPAAVFPESKPPAGKAPAAPPKPGPPAKGPPPNAGPPPKASPKSKQLAQPPKAQDATFPSSEDLEAFDDLVDL